MILQSRPGRFRLCLIFVATAKGLERFDGLDDMPPVMRAQCLKALEGKDSGTVVIAGQAEAAADCDPGQRKTAAAALASPSSSFPPARRAKRVAAAVQVLVAALAAACWLLARL